MQALYQELKRDAQSIGLLAGNGQQAPQPKPVPQPTEAQLADALRTYSRERAREIVMDPNNTGEGQRLKKSLSTWNGRIKKHLEPDWKDCPLELITIQAVNDWAWKKRQAGLSWVVIKDALRTMQRVLSAFPKNTLPPFSQKGLRVPERDKLAMKINSRQRISFSWAQAVQIAEYIRGMDSLGDSRREQYSTLILLDSASGLRGSELLALRVNDVDFKARTIRVEESSDQRSGGMVGACKNAAAYRTVHLGDAEGHSAMERLKAISCAESGTE